MVQLTGQSTGTPLPYREPFEVQGKENNAENTKQELGDSNADHTRNGQHVIGNFPLFQGGDHAQQNAQHRRNNQSSQRQLDGGGKFLHHQLADGHVVLQGIPKVPGTYPLEPIEIADDHGAVQTLGHPEGLNLLRGHFGQLIHGDQEIDHVTGHQFHAQIDEKRDDQQHGNHAQQFS